MASNLLPLPRTRVVKQALSPSLLSAVRREALAAHKYVTEQPRSSAATGSDDDEGGPTATFWCPSAKLTGTAPTSSEKPSAIERALGELLRLAIATESADGKSTGNSDGDAPELIVEGGEWWVQHRHPQASQDFHFDFDQGHFLAGNGLRFPKWSSILYLSDEGGPTVVLDQRSRPVPTRGSLAKDWLPAWLSGGAKGNAEGDTELTLAPADATEADVMHPSYGAYALFRGELLHGVLPPLDPAGTPPPPQWQTPDAPYAAPTAATDGMRTTLLVNWWVQEKPVAPSCVEPAPALRRAISAAHGGHDHADACMYVDVDAGGEADEIPSPEELPEVMLLGSACQQLALDISLPDAPGSEHSTTTNLFLPMPLGPEHVGHGMFTVAGMETLRFFRAMHE